MIYINWDFSTGDELSYVQSRKMVVLSFETHCLEFFSFEYPCVLVNEKGNILTPKMLLDDKENKYCDKEIRKCHDLRKLLLAGKFKGWEV